MLKEKRRIKYEKNRDEILERNRLRYHNIKNKKE
jgi:hypothetical protein